MYNNYNFSVGNSDDKLLKKILGEDTRVAAVNSSVEPNTGTSDGCGIPDGARTWGIEGYPLASVYSPIQKFDDIYDPETALSKGTMFIELDLPFNGRTVSKGGKCCD